MSLLAALPLAAVACGPPRLGARAPSFPTGRADAAIGSLALPGGSPIRVTVDRARVADGPRDVATIAGRGRLLALSDSYASRPGGLSFCQAGRETWFRVIDTIARVERYARPADSCHGGAQSGDPPFTVEDGGARIRLHLLSEPPITISLKPDGRVTASR